MRNICQISDVRLRSVKYCLLEIEKFQTPQTDPPTTEVLMLVQRVQRQNISRPHRFAEGLQNDQHVLEPGSSAEYMAYFRRVSGSLLNKLFGVLQLNFPPLDSSITHLVHYFSPVCVSQTEQLPFSRQRKLFMPPLGEATSIY